jgi:tetratricopeptide (TPR) repeat protein
VAVEEGVVEIRDRKNLAVARVPAGQNWSQPRASRVAAAGHARPSSPATEPDPDQDLADARAARAASDPRRAVAIYQRLAGGGGPLAENALYELGGIYRDQLADPRKALAAWERYRSRYPRGLLRAEADLSIVDTLSHLGDMKRALKEADAFLLRYPRSERRAEVARVATEARRALGQSGAGPSD